MLAAEFPAASASSCKDVLCGQHQRALPSGLPRLCGGHQRAPPSGLPLGLAPDPEMLTHLNSPAGGTGTGCINNRLCSVTGLPKGRAVRSL